MEVVLDRGQRDDWLESRFIMTFLFIAVSALVVAIVWELRQPDPVVELGLLRERNFAISNCFYFLFGFVLFGSTVLIPADAAVAVRIHCDRCRTGARVRERW